MKQKRVWRYYCDHCRKGGCGKAAMLKHERHCIRNPQRECRMCKHVHEDETAKVSELVEAAQDDLNKLREVSHGCPVCMLAGIVNCKEMADSCCMFDFKAEQAQVWNEINSTDAERYGIY